MIPTSQVLVKGVDFTALVSASGAQHNQLVESAVLASRRGIIISTTDTALNTPDEPDISGSPDLADCLWLRVPFNNTYDPTLYYFFDGDWVNLIVDIAALTSAIDDAQADADTALDILDTTNTNLAATSVTAGQALIAANEAQIDATTGVVNSAAAQTTASTAQGTANTALSLGLKLYTSTIINLTLGAIDSIDEAHGLANTPVIVRPVLICKEVDMGYAVGDEIGPESIAANPGLFGILYAGANATNVFSKMVATVATPNSPFLLIRNKTTGVFELQPDRLKWAMKVYAFARQ